MELTGNSLPLMYKIKAAYTLKRESHFKETKYHTIYSFGDYKYVDASYFMQFIKETFRRNHIKYDNHVIDTFESNYREPFSIKI